MSTITSNIIRFLARRMASAVANSDNVTRNQIGRAIRDPKKLDDKINVLEGVRKQKIEPEAPERPVVKGEDLADQMLIKSQADPNNTNGGKPWTSEQINHIRENDFVQTQERVDDILRYDEELRKHIKANPVKPVEQMQGVKTAASTVNEPIIIGSDGFVKDGYNRLNQLSKSGLGDQKVNVLVGKELNYPSVALADNATEVILDRFGSFINSLKLAVKNYEKAMKSKTPPEPMRLKEPKTHTSLFNLKERHGYAGVLVNSTKIQNGKASVLDDELLAGLAVDVLNVLKNNKGGRAGIGVKGIENQRYLEPKPMNQLQEEIGNAAERRIMEKIRLSGEKNWKDRTITRAEKRALASGLIEFARGNFGQNRNPLTDITGQVMYKPAKEGLSNVYTDTRILNRPSLLLEKTAISKKKGQDFENVLLTTSDFYDEWYRAPAIKQNRTGSNGKVWIQILDGPSDPALPGPVFHGKWKLDRSGNVVDQPVGQRPEDFLAGRDKSNYSLSKFDPTVLNILGETKVGVDKGVYPLFKELSRRGYFKDTGMTNDDLRAFLRKEGYTADEEDIMVRYYKDLDDLRETHIAREQLARKQDGKKPLTQIEKNNAFRGKKNKVRKEISDDYREALDKLRKDDKGTGIDYYIDYLSNIGGRKGTLRDIQDSQRSIRKRLINEIDKRFKADDYAEVYIPHKFDYRGRVYAIDPSGANVQTGGFIRHMLNFADDLAVPVLYGDPAFKRIVDDLILFEEMPIKGANIGKSTSTGLERYAYYKKNEAYYLKKGRELLDISENQDSTVLENYNPKWLKGRGDAGPFVRSLMEIARIKRAYDTPPGAKQGEMFNKTETATNVGITPKTQIGVVNKGTNKEGLTTAQGYVSGFSSEQAPRQAYMSKMAIEFDAPQSGSQHIGAQMGDTGILWQTSVYTEKNGVKRILNDDEIRLLEEGVAPEGVAPDLYRDVGVDYNKFWRKYLETLSEKDPALAKLYDTISKEYMSGDRGIVKPIVMKIPYGASFMRLRNNLFEQLTPRKKLEIKQKYGIEPKEFMDVHWDAMEKALVSGLKTQFEFKHWNEALGYVYKNAHTMTNRNRDPLLVNSPYGGVSDFTLYAAQTQTMMGHIRASYLPDFPKIVRMESKGKGKAPRKVYAKTDYHVTESVPVAPADMHTQTLYNKPLKEGKITQFDLDLMAVEGKMLKEGKFAAKAKTSMYTALAPNATHSLDAGFLQQLVKEADKAGIPVMVVHDAFFIRPTDVDAFRKLAGSVFQDMHNGYNLRKEMIDGVAKATGIPVKQVIELLEARLQEVAPNPELDRVARRRSGYDINRLESTNLSAEQGGPLGPKDLFTPEGVVGRESGIGETVNLENVIRGG